MNRGLKWTSYGALWISALSVCHPHPENEEGTSKPTPSAAVANRLDSREGPAVVNDRQGWMNDFVISMDLPEYPAISLRQGVGGIAVAEFVVGTDGRVSDINILEAPDEHIGGAVRASLSTGLFQRVFVRGDRPAIVRTKQVFYFDADRRNVRTAERLGSNALTEESASVDGPIDE